MPTNNAVVAAKPIDRFKQELTLRKDMMLPLLPKNINFDKFQAIVIAAVGSNPDLLDCDRASLLKSCVQASELGLSLNPTLGEGDILKVWNNKTKKYDAQFRPRYMGLMKLARQSGEVMKIEAEIVRENDEFLIQKGDEPRLDHRIKLGKRGDMIGAYCIWTLRDGHKQFEVMDRDQILAIRDRSSAKTKDGRVVGPWATDEEEMWRKTVVRRASKYMPRATDAFTNAVALDNLHEVGHEVEIQNGEVIDITADEPGVTYDADTGEVFEEAKPAAAMSQLSKIAEKAAKPKPEPKAEPAPEPEPEPVAEAEIAKLEITHDADGDEDWKAWLRDAIRTVRDLQPGDKKRWKTLHKDMIDEAELMEPEASMHLMKALNKE